MGANLSGISCLARHNEEQPITSDLQESEETSTCEPSQQAETIADDGLDKACEQSQASNAADTELQAQIKTIVSSRAQQRKQPHLRVDAQLQAHINGIVKQRKELKDSGYIAAIENLGQQTENQELEDSGYIAAIENAQWDPSWPASMMGENAQWEPSYWQSPVKSPEDAQWEASSWQSPAWSPACSRDGLQEQISAIVGAHSKCLKQQRCSLDLASPSPSPAKLVSDFEQQGGFFAQSFQQLDWSTCDNDVAPCKLSFAGCGDAATAPTIQIDSSAPCTAQSQEKNLEKVEIRTFNVCDIPSPTRNRTRKQLWADVELPETETAHEVKDEPEDESAAASVQSAKLLRESEQKAEMDAMDKLCVDTFLESVKKCAWRERVRTPIKGSNLYTKHIRPARHAGTSVDVKDSSFKNLGSFLEFLQSEGLLCLKHGLRDPVVNVIDFDACRKYKYDAQQQQHFLAGTRAAAPHEAGCSCRLCLACAPSTSFTSWQ